MDILYGVHREGLKMDDEQFERLVLDALEELPEQFRAQIENVEIVVERWPGPQHRRALGLKPWQRYTVYGLYQGIPLTERSSSGYGLVQPDIITLFSAPLMRDFPHPDTLREEVRRTLLHELAHYFGIDDHRLDELGAY